MKQNIFNFQNLLLLALLAILCFTIQAQEQDQLSLTQADTENINNLQQIQSTILAENDDDDNDDDDDDDSLTNDSNNFQCQTVDDCESLHYCNEQHQCVHKALFPLTGQEIFGIVVILVLVGFAQAGGIGGGPILMPILLGIMGYETKQAIALSFVLIFGGSCGNFLNNSGNQTKNQTPLIWYDLVLISLPYLMAGAIFGVAINHFLPSSVIVVILIFVLYNSAQKTYKKYKQMVQKEKQEQQDQNVPLMDIKSDPTGRTQYPKNEQISPQLQEIYDREKIQYPTDKFFKMFVVLVIIIALSLIKGGKGMESLIGIEACGLGYWAVNFVIVIVCIFISKRFVLDMLAFENLKTEHGFDFDKYGEKFGEEKVDTTSKAAIVAGFVGGLLGLGGGVILTPKWLDMGIPSDRTASTATFTVCFTSFISFFASALAGKYEFTEVIFFWSISFVASYFVSRFLKYVVEKYKKQSILIGVLLVVIMLALTLLPIVQVISMISDPSQIYTLGRLC